MQTFLCIVVILIFILVEKIEVTCRNQITDEEESLHRHKYNEQEQRFSCSSEKTSSISSLLKDYDKRSRPLVHENRPVIIEVGISIVNIGTIDEVNMDYVILLHLRQYWRDPRLKNLCSKEIIVSHFGQKDIWTPDTFFRNSKFSKIHSTPSPNRLLKVNPDGSVFYTMRISLRASCPMSFWWYPVDTQECYLSIQSFGHTTREMKYKWVANDRILLRDRLSELPEYNVTRFTVSEKDEDYPIGKWSTLVMRFKVERYLGNIFLHLYSPCSLIVILSWVTFFIPKEGIGARIRLSIIAVLSILTIFNTGFNTFVKVSYMKFADWYLIVSFMFVFGVLIEYLMVLWLIQRDVKTRKGKKRWKKSRNQSEYWNLGDSAVIECKPLPKKGLRDISFVEPEHYGGSSSSLIPDDNSDEDVGMGFQQDEDDEGEYLSKSATVYFIRIFRVESIDEYSRIFFPLAFLLFNVVYWWLFFSKRYALREG